jgi:protein-disulfide isomerase
LPQIEQQYIATGKVRFIYRPVGMFADDRNARLAAEALYCAGEQGKFWDMNDWLFANVDSWSAAEVVPTIVNTAAPALGLDATKLNDCLFQERYASRVQGFVDDASRRGIYSTPTFLINEQLLVGKRSFEEFSSTIEQELQK